MSPSEITTTIEHAESSRYTLKVAHPSLCNPTTQSRAHPMAAFNRRTFLKTSSAAGASLLLTGTRASGKILGANDRLRIAVAGLNGRGQSHLSGWMEQENVEIAYLIDPDKKVLAAAMNSLQGKLKENFKAKGVADVREALEDKNLDAISVATPNHWHSLITIWAA